MSEDIGKILGSEDPIAIFNSWFEQAKDKAYESSMNEATAFTLATSSASGGVSTRIVLLKQMTESGFRFFTSYSSKKALEIEANPMVALNFYWPQIFRQVKIQGQVAKTSRQVSEDYWNSRPKGSQVSQALSDQSKPIASRQALEDKHKALANEFADKPVPCPEDWGGYEVTPERIEFWQGQDNRLHDRFVFTKTAAGWSTERLQP